MINKIQVVYVRQWMLHLYVFSPFLKTADTESESHMAGTHFFASLILHLPSSQCLFLVISRSFISVFLPYDSGEN